MSRCIQLKYASVRGHTDLKPATFECLQRKKQVLISNNADCSKVLVLVFFFSTLRKPLLWTVPSHSKIAFVCWIVYCVLTSYMLITKNSHPLPLCTENDCNFKHPNVTMLALLRTKSVRGPWQTKTTLFNKHFQVFLIIWTKWIKWIKHEIKMKVNEEVLSALILHFFGYADLLWKIK